MKSTVEQEINLYFVVFMTFWLKFNLSERTFNLIIINFSSSTVPLSTILEPVLFSVHMLPLSLVIAEHNLSFIFMQMINKSICQFCQQHKSFGLYFERLLLGHSYFSTNVFGF